MSLLLCSCSFLSALLGMLYAEEKERLDFVYTIYHWWQAIAIFIVYLWSHLPMRVGLCIVRVQPPGKIFQQIVNENVLTWLPSLQAKLSILLAFLLVACYCYWLMERRLAKKVPYRLPRIPRPRHKVTPRLNLSCYLFFFPNPFFFNFCFLIHAHFKQMICFCIIIKMAGR